MKHSRRSILIRTFAISFIAFLIATVVVANRGLGAQFWPFLDHIPYGDKLGHLGLFGTLSLLCNLAFPDQPPRHWSFLATKTTLVLLTIVSLEELSQIFISTRNFDLIDWLADLIGLAAGQFAALLIIWLSNNRSPLPASQKR